MSLDVTGAGGMREMHAAQGARTQGTHQASGQWNGLSVRVNDAASLLADAAEEIGFAASEKMEKKLSERRKPEEKRRMAEVAPPPKEKLDEMRGAMKDRLEQLLAGVKASGGNPAALRDALKGFTDPTERHAAMEWLEEQFEDQPSLAEMVRKERTALEASSAREVQAGYNIYGVDASDVGGPGEGAALYRRTILGHADVTDSLEAILGEYGAAGLEKGIDFLRRAIGADLSATNSSTDKRELEATNNDLFNVRAIGNFARQFEESVNGLRESRGKPPLPNAGVDTLRVLFKAKGQRLVQLDGLKQALKLEGRVDAEYDVQALTRTHNLARNLPGKLFADEESRQRLLGVSQKLLDTAIDLEEELLEGEG